jgi:hypothetical protein
MADASPPIMIVSEASVARARRLGRIHVNDEGALGQLGGYSGGTYQASRPDR